MKGNELLGELEVIVVHRDFEVHVKEEVYNEFIPDTYDCITHTTISFDFENYEKFVKAENNMELLEKIVSQKDRYLSRCATKRLLGAVGGHSLNKHKNIQRLYPLALMVSDYLVLDSEADRLANSIIEKQVLWEEAQEHSKKIRAEMLKNHRQIFADLVARDGCKCQFCGATTSLVIDHIRPVIRFGTNDLRNLQILCDTCNSKKAARYDEDI